MNSAKRLKTLTETEREVFTASDLRDLWGDKPGTATAAAKRMVEKGLLVKVAKGYYALDEDFSVWELANLIVSPSYVSMDSALFYQGVSFQKTKRVNSVATLNYEREIRGYTFKYYSMKESLFFNLEGLDYEGELSIAYPERALLDCFYFGVLPNIDNEEKINPSYLKRLSSFYPKAVRKKASRFL